VKMVEESEKAEELSSGREANWPAVLFFIHIHLLSLYGIWVLFYEVQWLTCLLCVTTGAHRLWAHRSYEASTGLRIVLMLFQTLVGQGSIYDWVQYHRFHHAHFGTNLDPYDYTKGFLYAHMLTRLRKLSPKQEKLKEAIDMSDLESDSVVMFQKKLYWLLYGVFFLLLPLNAPLEYWDDSVWGTVFVVGFLRYAIVLHASWLVESAIYFGCSTTFIRVYAALGLATNLRTVDTKTIQTTMAQMVKTKRPLQDCLEEAMKEQVLPEDHFLR
ncbi:Acyl-CoA desaturase BmorPDSN, partial [Operophtera brumata]